MAGEILNILQDASALEKARVLWYDKNTGLRNSRGFAEAPRDPSRPYVAHISVEGTKWMNRAGHAAGNMLYRTAGRALAAVAPDAAKWKGDFVVRCASRADAVRIAKAMRENLNAMVREANRETHPRLTEKMQGFDVTVAVIRERDDIEAAIAAVTKRHGEEKKAREESNPPRRAKRGVRPFGIPVRHASGLEMPTELPPLPQPTDAQLRRAAGMTTQEVLELAYVEPATGMLTHDGFFALPKQRHVASIDLNGLNAINEEFGHEAGDAVLRAFERLARRAAREVGVRDLSFAHLSGDEYAVMSNGPVFLQDWIDMLGEMCDHVVHSPTLEGYPNGITFGYGIAGDYDQADALVEGHKKRGVEAERADRAGRLTARLAVRRGRDLQSRGEPQPRGPRQEDGDRRRGHVEEAPREGPSAAPERHGGRGDLERLLATLAARETQEAHRGTLLRRAMLTGDLPEPGDGDRQGPSRLRTDATETIAKRVESELVLKHEFGVEAPAVSDAKRPRELSPEEWFQLCQGRSVRAAEAWFRWRDSAPAEDVLAARKGEGQGARLCMDFRSTRAWAQEAAKQFQTHHALSRQLERGPRL